MLIRSAWPFKEDEGRMSCLLTLSPPHQPSYLPFDITVLPSALPLEKKWGWQLQAQQMRNLTSKLTGNFY